VTDADLRPQTSLRVDWILTVLSVWLIGGFYVDLWAHAHGRVDDTFFTPWHAFLYTGAASFGVVLGVLSIFGSPRRVAVRDALPGPYRQAFLGAVLFVAASALDLVWHTVFGFEVDVEALLSPTHLLLATAGVLMLGGPLRSASARLANAPPGTRSWRLSGPFVIPLTMTFAVLVAFSQYANPIVDPWSSAIGETLAAPEAQIYSMATDGRRQTRLTIAEGDARGARFSPDGASIAYSVGRDGADQIHLMTADGSGDRPLTNDGSSFRPAWSPDGSLILFAGTREGEPDLFVMRADGSDVRQLTDDPASDWAANWSPDGAQIAFNSNRAGTFDIFRIEADGSNPTALTAGPADDFEPAWSPDGTRIAFTSNRGGDFAIWVIAADGSGEPAMLDTGDGNAYMPAWSPDGELIAFTSSRTGDFEVFVVAAAGGEPTNLSHNPGSDDGWIAPAWAPDGSAILYPSIGSTPYWRESYVRQGFGAAGVLIFAGLLGAFAAVARRRGRLPFGTFLVLVAVPAAMATVLSDEYRFIPGAIVAGVLADVAARLWPAGSSRVGDGLVAFLVPALFFACYFGAVALTTGLGWSIHLWLGAIFIAGAIGFLLDELIHGPTIQGPDRPIDDMRGVI
jgi:WD40 repeat protein